MPDDTSDLPRLIDIQVLFREPEAAILARIVERLLRMPDLASVGITDQTEIREADSALSALRYQLHKAGFGQW